MAGRLIVLMLLAAPGWAVAAEPSAPLPAEASPTSSTPTWPARIDTITLHGLWRTDPGLVLRELPYRAGEVVSAAQWQLGIARLWNIGLFSQVKPEFREVGGKRHLVLKLEERWTLNPLISFQVLVKRDAEAGQESTWWSLGASDLNVGGRLIEVGARFERFNAYSGGQVYVRDWRFLRQRIDALAQFDLLVRPRIGFADRRMMLRLELGQLLHADRVRLAARLDLMRDQFFDAGDTPPNLPPDANTALLQIAARFGRIDVVRIRHVGQSIEVQPAVALNDVKGHRLWPHMQAWMVAQGFWAPGERWNFALRLQGGIQTRAPAQQQFFLGGLYEVRGGRDSFLRADRYVLGNAEVRYTAFDSTWLALVPTLFVDAALARDATLGNTVLASTGAGVRFLVPRLVRTGLRVDVAQPLAGYGCSGASTAGLCPGLSLGVFQYF